MTDNTHTDNEELRNNLAKITAGFFMATDPDRVALQKLLTEYIQANYTSKVRDKSSPTKSSGELEDLTVFQAALNGLKRSGVKDTTRFEETWKLQLLSYVTTQTTKLQAEARLDELEKLDAQREGKEYESKLLGNPMTVYEVPINLIWNRIAELKRELAQLEREHKIGEDGE